MKHFYKLLILIVDIINSMIRLSHFKYERNKRDKQRNSLIVWNCTAQEALTTHPELVVAGDIFLKVTEDLLRAYIGLPGLLVPFIRAALKGRHSDPANRLAEFSV